jgi:purine-cytosine permease-like protein
MVSAVHIAVFLVIATLSASPAYYFLRRTDRGRARGSIAYLSGFIVGMFATCLLPPADPRMFEAGLVAAFAGPFIGMARAGYMRRRRERNKQLRRARIQN